MSADLAVRVFKSLENDDVRVLLAIELGMGDHEYVLVEKIVRFSSLTEDDTSFRLKRLFASKLIRGCSQPYIGYNLNYAGYDCLAINALVKRGILEAFGKPLGVGKESDVYDALTPSDDRVAVKFHRLGRLSFRQTKRVRNYAAERRHLSWLYQSRLAAEREHEALKTLFPRKIAVPEPVAQNRHTVIMGMIKGAELADYVKVSRPKIVLKEILENVQRAYLEAGVIHADLSEFNVILKSDGHVLIIDWPQYIKRSHPNADDLLKRDVGNIIKYFGRNFEVKYDLEEALTHVRGEG